MVCVWVTWVCQLHSIALVVPFHCLPLLELLLSFRNAKIGVQLIALVALASCLCVCVPTPVNPLVASHVFPVVWLHWCGTSTTPLELLMCAFFYGVYFLLLWSY